MMTTILRPLPFLLFITVALLLLSTSGCKTRPFPTDQEPALHFNWAQETPESLLASIQSQANTLNNFTAFFQISMDPPPAKMPSSFSGILYISKEGGNTRLRIKAFHLFGTTLFDMVTQDGITKVYIPGKHTLYVGKIDEEQQRHQGQGPQEIFSSLMINFAELVANPEKNLSIEQGIVKVPLVNGELVLDKKNGHILSLTEKEKRITYNAYQKLAPNQPAMPTDINLTSPHGNARCQLKEITLYKTMGQEHFDLSKYLVKEIKALSDAGKE